MKKIFNIIIPILYLFSGCQNDDSSGGNFVAPANVPILKTIEAIQINQDSAVSGGIIEDDNGFQIVEKGICWDTLPNPNILDWKSSGISGIDSFEAYMVDLNPETKYYYRSYAKNSKGTGYGDQLVLNSNSGFTGNSFKMELSGIYNLSVNDTVFEYMRDTINFDLLHIFQNYLDESGFGLDSILFGLSLANLEPSLYSQEDINPITDRNQIGIVTYLNFDSIQNPYSLFSPIEGEIKVQNFGTHVEINFSGILVDDFFLFIGSNQDTLIIEEGQIIMEL